MLRISGLSLRLFFISNLFGLFTREIAVLTASESAYFSRWLHEGEGIVKD